jgi:thioredoxin 1
MKFRISAIVVLLILPFLLLAQRQDVDSIQNLNPEEFYLKLHSENNPVLIDSRTGDDFSKERIHGAILAESKADLTSITDTLDRERPLFLYCEYNQRSPAACSLLIEKGFSNVYNLEGGLIQWRALEYELDRKKIRNRRKAP